MRSILAHMCGLLTVMSNLWAADLPPGQSAGRGKYYPLQLTAGRLLIAARVNDRDIEALLDSAAEATILDMKFAKAIGLSSGEHAVGQGSGQSSFEAELVNGVTLGAIGLTLTNQSVAVADLSDVSHRLLGRPIDAIFGRELFDAARLEIDIVRRRIRVRSNSDTPRGVPLALVTEHGVETIPASIEGHAPVRATFDLGNGTHVLVARRYAEQLGLLTDGRPVSRERGGGLGGETVREVITLRSIEIAGRRFANVTAALDSQPSASDLNVGVSLLRHFIITADYAGRVVWLLPTSRSGPSP